jgi:hypothetical protein
MVILDLSLRGRELGCGDGRNTAIDEEPSAMNHLWHLWQEIMRYAGRMGPQEWFFVLAAMIVVAVVCLRGYGSRKQY